METLNSVLLSKANRELGDAPHWRAFGDFAFDRLKFPDLALLVETVRKLTNGARIIASIWPLMEPSSENWLDYISSGLVAGSTQGTGVVEFFNGTAMHLLDYTNPMTRNKTWSKIIDNYYNIGIRDFLLDCTEGGGVGEVCLSDLSSEPYSDFDRGFHSKPSRCILSRWYLIHVQILFTRSALSLRLEQFFHSMLKKWSTMV